MYFERSESDFHHQVPISTRASQLLEADYQQQIVQQAQQQQQQQQQQDIELQQPQQQSYPSGLSRAVTASNPKSSLFARSLTTAPASPTNGSLSMPIWPIISGLLSVLIHLATLLTDLLLMYDYYYNGFQQCTLGLIIIRGINIIVLMEFDWLNNGLTGACSNIIFNILQIRIIKDYIVYMYKYIKSYSNVSTAATISAAAAGQNVSIVPGSDANNSTTIDTAGPITVNFHLTYRFQSFQLNFPSLIIQTYVIIFDVSRSMNFYQLLGICLSSGSAAIDLLDHFQYINVSNSIYCAQIFKAIGSTLLRTILVSILFNKITYWTYLWIIISFVIGCIVYTYFIRYESKQHHDIPLNSAIQHITYGGLIASLLLFTSIPFAGSHSIKDWWSGYIISEIKLQFENLIMLIIVLYYIYYDYRINSIELFYSIVGFCAIIYLGNLLTLKFLHRNVTQQLLVKGRYTNNIIIQFWLEQFKRLKKNSKKVIDNDGLQRQANELQLEAENNGRIARLAQNQLQQQQQQQKSNGLPTHNEDAEFLQPEEAEQLIYQQQQQQQQVPFNTAQYQNLDQQQQLDQILYSQQLQQQQLSLQQQQHQLIQQQQQQSQYQLTDNAAADAQAQYDAQQQYLQYQQQLADLQQQLAAVESASITINTTTTAVAPVPQPAASLAATVSTIPNESIQSYDPLISPSGVDTGDINSPINPVINSNLSSPSSVSRLPPIVQRQTD